MDIKSIFKTFVISTCLATTLAALVAIFDPWTGSQTLPSLQPMANTLQLLWYTATTTFAMHVAVGEQVQWYGFAILFASAAICLLTAALMRAAAGTPRTFSEWMPYVVMLPIIGAVTAIAAAMWVPFLVDHQMLLDNTVLDLSHLLEAIVEIQAFLLAVGAKAASSWNWWIWAAIMAILNLPALTLVAITSRNQHDEQGITLIFMRQV